MIIPPDGSDYARLRNVPFTSLRLSGAVGNASGDITVSTAGFTDDSSAINAYLATFALMGGDFLVDRWYYVPLGFNVPSNVRFWGSKGGGFRGNGSFVGTGVPIPFSAIKCHGTIMNPSTALAFPAMATSGPITAGTKSFGVTGNVAVKNAFVLLSNQPTDSGGTDAFTMSTDGTQRWYNVGSLGGVNQKQDPNNRRQFSRIEPMIVEAATATNLTTYAPNGYAYNDAGVNDKLQFRQFLPNSNVEFVNVNVVDLVVDGYLTYNFRWWGGSIVRSTVSAARSLFPQIVEVFLDAQDTDSCVNVGASTVEPRITGKFQGGAISTDNGLVRVDQALNIYVNVTVSGHKDSLYGAIFDTSYFEDPGDSTLGAFPDVPLRGGIVIIINTSVNIGAIFTCDVFAAPLDNLNITMSSYQNTLALYLKGCANTDVNATLGSGTLQLDGCTGVNVSGHSALSYNNSWNSMANPRNAAQTRANTVIKVPTMTTLA